MVNRDGTVAEWIGPPANGVEPAPAVSGPGCAGSCFSMPPPARQFHPLLLQHTTYSVMNIYNWAFVLVIHFLSL